jgi:Zn ribbon nucleic-acid-binding protein
MKAYKFNMEMFKNDYDYAANQVLFELPDDQVDISSVILFNGQHYRVCMISQKKGFVGVKETEYNVDGKEYDFEQYITCPYCGHQDKDSWEVSEDDGKIECGACGSEFSYERIVDVSYSTRPIKPTEVKTIVAPPEGVRR